jgi:hypothetical protein
VNLTPRWAGLLGDLSSMARIVPRLPFGYPTDPNTGQPDKDASLLQRVMHGGVRSPVKLRAASAAAPPGRTAALPQHNAPETQNMATTPVNSRPSSPVRETFNEESEGRVRTEGRLEQTHTPLSSRSRRRDGSESPQPRNTPDFQRTRAQIHRETNPEAVRFRHQRNELLARSNQSSQAQASFTTTSATGTVNLHGPLEVFARDYFAKGVSLPVLTHFSPEFSEAYPQVRAKSKVGYLVECTDGKTRRFPNDAGTMSFMQFSPIHGPEMMGSGLSRQLGYIYDSHNDHVRETVGEYRLNPDDQTISYYVRGNGVQSIRDNAAVYPLGDGKWMIPQHEFRACTEAAEEMLLAEGKSTDQVIDQTKNAFQGGESQRRETEDVVRSLEARSGRSTTVLKGIDPMGPGSLDRLQRAIENDGPCILLDAGHARILDRIEATQHGYVLDVRDPFAGSVLRVSMHDEFARMPRLEDHLHRWDAVFLNASQA